MWWKILNVKLNCITFSIVNACSKPLLPEILDALLVDLNFIKAPQNLPIELVDGSHVLSPGTVILRPVSIMRRGRVLTAITQFERAQGNTSTPENNSRESTLNFFSCLF